MGIFKKTVAREGIKAGIYQHGHLSDDSVQLGPQPQGVLPHSCQRRAQKWSFLLGGPLEAGGRGCRCAMQLAQVLGASWERSVGGPGSSLMPGPALAPAGAPGMCPIWWWLLGGDRRVLGPPPYPSGPEAAARLLWSSSCATCCWPGCGGPRGVLGGCVWLPNGGWRHRCDGQCTSGRSKASPKFSPPTREESPTGTECHLSLRLDQFRGWSCSRTRLPLGPEGLEC